MLNEFRNLIKKILIGSVVRLDFTNQCQSFLGAAAGDIGQTEIRDDSTCTFSGHKGNSMSASFWRFSLVCHRLLLPFTVIW